MSLLKLMLKGSNLLMLDEPTNHLDIHSREALENALISYGGTLLVVSHDRYLINKLADRIILLGADGTTEINGNYDDYIAAAENVQKTEKPVQKKPDDYKLRKERESSLRKLKSALARTEKEIDELEAKIAQSTELLSQPEYASEYEKAMELSLEIDKMKQREDELTTQWMEISESIETFT